MSEAINSRPGPWLSEGNWTYTLQHAGWRRGEEQFENRLFAQVQPGRNISLAEANSIASLFAEAGNVLHETGLTPRQLVEQRDALVRELEAVRDWARTERVALRKQEIDSIDRVLALVEGATP